jgi:2-oxoisovalerate dehydrogenase E1 component
MHQPEVSAEQIILSMTYNRYNYTDQQLLSLYYELLKPRMIEEKMLILLRQGRVSKWFSGIGQEAISVGLTQALHQDEFILPLHRNLGVFTGRNLPLPKLFAQLQGKKSGYTKGRDRSFHFGTVKHHVVGMISHLGPQMALADGIALANKLGNEAKISAVFSGDGGSSEGDFHEALNVAAVWELPVLFVIENNGYGLSTPSNEQFRFKHFVDKGPGYGMRTVQIDGNNILEVYHTINQLAEEMRHNPHPVLLECLTFRMRGHEEASGTKYVPQHLFDVWEKKDPLINYQNWLKQEGVLNDALELEYRAHIKADIEEAISIAFPEAEPVLDVEEELNDLFAPHPFSITLPKNAATSEKRLVDAISDGLRQSMERFPKLVLMGQDIAEYGGVFKVTEGFVEQFGKGRVRNTPLCESAIIGAGLGLSIKGYKAMVEMQFADFVTVGFNQIVNNLAKLYWRWEQNADVVVRMPTGAGVGAGPFHSQSNEAWFFHVPGLKIVYPSNPSDAKGLLCAALEDPNPVLFFEHKAMYRSQSGEVHDDYYTLPIGVARRVQEGESVSIITYGMGVHWATALAAQHPDYSLDIIDLRTLLPWDKEMVAASVAKTGKALVLHEDTLTGGIGAEIAAWIGEHCFRQLDAPVIRVGSLDTPVPFAPSLEVDYLPTKRLAEAVAKLIQW